MLQAIVIHFVLSKMLILLVCYIKQSFSNVFHRNTSTTKRTNFGSFVNFEFNIEFCNAATMKLKFWWLWTTICSGMIYSQICVFWTVFETTFICTVGSHLIHKKWKILWPICIHSCPGLPLNFDFIFALYCRCHLFLFYCLLILLV